MRKFKLTLFVLLLALLTVFAVGCAEGGDDRLDGKNIVTFEMNGGILKYGTSNTNTKINFAYTPGSKILDPSCEIPNYEIYRVGYNFTGWYKTAECNENDKWNFDTYFESESMTLYAGWALAVKHTFDVCYVDDGGNAVVLGSRDTQAGGKMSEMMVKNLAKRKDFTPIGYYADKEMTTPWNFDGMVHPGGDSDLSIPIYVKYIEGEWTLVDSFTTLKSAVRKNENVYLTANIDCGGGEFSFTNEFSGKIAGNGYSVRNFTVKASEGSLATRNCAIFGSLGTGASISDISFLDVKYVINAHASYLENTAIKFAAIALSADGATISNVTVSGSLTTNYLGELPETNLLALGEAVIENSTANITVTVQ